MGLRKVIAFAACLLILQVSRVQGQAISTESYAATSVSNPSSCGSGCPIIIPAIIKPVLAESYTTAPVMPDFSGAPGGYAGGQCGWSGPPIIIEEGGSKNDMLLPLILMFALKNMGGGRSGGFGSFGGYGMPGYSMGGYGIGYGGMGYGSYGGYGNGGYGGYSNGGYGGYSNGGYGGYSNGCGCGCGSQGCNFPYSNGCNSSSDSSCNGPTEINLIIKTDSCQSTCSE